MFKLTYLATSWWRPSKTPKTEARIPVLLEGELLGPYHTSALLNALADIHHIHEEDHLYMFVLSRCAEVVKAQGGTFFTVQEEVGELVPQAVKGISLNLLREIPFKMKAGISGWVATNRRAAVVENAQNDDRFNRSVDVITGIRTRSLICVPIIRNDKVIGVLEMVNRVDGTFRDADLEFMNHMCDQVGVALENCRLYKETADVLAYSNGIINSLSGGFLSTDKDGRVVRCNNAATRILDIDSEDVIGKPVGQCLPKFPAFGAVVDAALKHESTAQRQELELQKPDGAMLIMGYSTFLIRDEAGHILGAGILFQDLTRLRHRS